MRSNWRLKRNGVDKAGTPSLSVMRWRLQEALVALPCAGFSFEPEAHLIR